MLKRSYAVSLLEYMVNNNLTNMGKTIIEFYYDLNNFFANIGLSLKKIGGRGAFRNLAEELLIKDLVNGLNVKEEKKNNIRTIHKSKGTEFESVLVYLDNDLENIIYPQIDGEDDDGRLYYVTLSKAQEFYVLQIINYQMKIN